MVHAPILLYCSLPCRLPVTVRSTIWWFPRYQRTVWCGELTLTLKECLNNSTASLANCCDLPVSVAYRMVQGMRLIWALFIREADSLTALRNYKEFSNLEENSTSRSNFPLTWPTRWISPFFCYFLLRVHDVSLEVSSICVFSKAHHPKKWATEDGKQFQNEFMIHGLISLDFKIFNEHSTW